jgi:Transposase DDE domain
MIIAGLDEDWSVLQSMFPPNWRALAKETGSLTRKLRSFKTEEEVMRTLLLHVANGYSLRETVTRAKLSGLAEVTDVALLKRLQCSEEWFKSLCMILLKERGINIDRTVHNNIQMRVVDGTVVKEPGKTGSEWRVHYSIRLPDLSCDYFKLTATKGVLTGESFKQYPVKKGDCIIGDRGYSTAQGIAYIASRKAYSLVRVNTSALSLFHLNEESKFDLLKTVLELQEEFATKECFVRLKTDENIWIQGRLCVIRKSKTAIELALKKLKRQASKRQSVLQPATIEFAKYIILFTTLPINQFSTHEVLEWYRLRWQIELVFKRLKSLTAFGHLPKYDDVSARSWLYGKLFVGLLTEKLILSARVFSPWGYCLSE